MTIEPQIGQINIVKSKELIKVAYLITEMLKCIMVFNRGQERRQSRLVPGLFSLSKFPFKKINRKKRVKS